MIILNKEQIKQKIKRMAMEIYENHANENEIILAGINTKGLALAKLLKQDIENLSPLKSIISHIELNPAQPSKNGVKIDLSHSSLNAKTIIIVDDVSNTGRTLFYAFGVLMDALPKVVETAVLIERTHKCFPVDVRFVGLRLATTLKEHIDVNLGSEKNWSAQLD